MLHWFAKVTDFISLHFHNYWQIFVPSIIIPYYLPQAYSLFERSRQTEEILHPLFRKPHKPPAGSLKVLHAPARRGGIRRASQTKIYNLETDEFVSNPPFLKTNLAGVISQPHFGGNE
jgi:hypothetical protein